jgi:hypothetical protein
MIDELDLRALWCELDDYEAEVYCHIYEQEFFVKYFFKNTHS